MTIETFITCKEGCDKILANEAASYNGKLLSKGRGWTRIKWSDKLPLELCFAYHIFKCPIDVRAASVNEMTEKLLTLFTAQLRDKRVEKPWPLLFSSENEPPLIHRAKTVEKNWLNKLQKKMSRVAKLAEQGVSENSKYSQGFFVFFSDFDKAVVSFDALISKQQRMQMDPDAPSRSFLKIEEAFNIFGVEPKKNDTVIDLGAAPGGWSHSALKRGAKVTAIDNGPLKHPVSAHPKLSHFKTDAFKYEYSHSKPADWLLCDILEQPNIVLALLRKWLKRKWCKYFVVNLKVGKNDPVILLKEIRNTGSGIASYCSRLCVKQLYHDREEITLMGKILE